MRQIFLLVILRSVEMISSLQYYTCITISDFNNLYRKFFSYKFFSKFYYARQKWLNESH
jgi:hypothetical protein